MSNVPVTGFLYHSDGDDPLHSHNMFITTWDGQPIHTHEFKGVTTFDVGHDHRYAGTTEPAPSGVQHTHRYCTFTTFDAEHKHVIRGVTGPAIFLPDGRHFHKFNGVTSVDGPTPHRHRYCGKTSL
ncbi:YmaF family protein [Halalkalibacter alkalisediminis]|uniref:YmaF family protein n=1 Tax=Halalkalibacter alkalisediminis TaxID=935616 RepID=A0ABV6NMG5_9BACI|nr:YmaF family protein [Halalkalibacter alkalisediminis]